jgi:protein-S-isoprenylcysteine O-methyltransferase Ste14
MLKLPPPAWTLLYLIAAGTASALYPWRSIVDLTSIPAGSVLLLLGVASALWASSIFRLKGTDLNPTSETNKLLVVTGPFRVSRNPMYLGLVLTTLGIAFCVGSLPMFAVPVLVFATTHGVHIPFEEAKMRRQFGSQFDDYTRRTRRWL